MSWFAVYRASDGALVSIGTVVADPLPSGLAVREYATQPQGIWDAAAREFQTRPRLRLVARDGTGVVVTTVYAVTARDAGIPAAKRLTVSGEVVTPQGTRDTLYSRAPWLLRIPHPRGGVAIVRVRVQAGVLELELPDGSWTAVIPFYSLESGEVDVGALFAGEFELETPLVVSLLLSR